MSITTGPQQNGGIFSRLDAYRFYIMSAIGLLLLGYLYVQRTSQQAPLDEVIPPSPSTFTPSSSAYTEYKLSVGRGREEGRKGGREDGRKDGRMFTFNGWQDLYV